MYAVDMPHHLQAPSISSYNHDGQLPFKNAQLSVEERHNVVLLRKLDIKTAAALGGLQTSMDSNNPHASSSKGSSPDRKGKGQDRPAIIFDGLLPRIETRGQSRHTSSRSGKKKDDRSPQQKLAEPREGGQASGISGQTDPPPVGDTTGPQGPSEKENTKA